MSVSIGAQGAQTYVQLNHGGKALQIPCDKNEAENVKKAAEELEAKMVEKEKQLGITPEQYMTAIEKQAAKPEGVGSKLDVTSKG